MASFFELSNNADYNDLLQHSKYEDDCIEQQYSRFRHSNSESFSEALTWAETTTRGKRMAEAEGPWDKLACWYWEYWDEIDYRLSHTIPDNDIQRTEIFGMEQSSSIHNCSWENKNPDIPPKALREELISLYFKHIHPSCPIFDEVDFYFNDTGFGDDLALLKRASLLEIQAMMFAGSLHISSEQILHTEYYTTSQCHSALFEKAKKTYYACNKADTLSKTRAALLLSFWKPYDFEIGSITYWADEAISNARATHLHTIQSEPTSPSPGRRKLIWWCCLLRNRLLAFSLHRVHCLYVETSTYNMVCREDFGLKAGDYCFMDLCFKLQEVDNFIHLCELSQLMAQILRFQAQSGYANDMGRINCIHTMELFQVTQQYKELVLWRKKFEGSFGDKLRQSAARSVNMPWRLTQILYRLSGSSVIATLYLPYTFLAPLRNSSVADSFSKIALCRVKEATSHIAKITKTLGNEANSHDIALELGAWIMFPIATKIVVIQNSTGIDTAFTEVEEMGDLMRVLYILKHRSRGGQFFSNVLDAVIAHISAHRAEEGHLRVVNQLQDAARIIKNALAYKSIMK